MRANTEYKTATETPASHRTSVKPDEIYATEDLADQLGTAIGLREQAPQIVAEAVRNRNGRLRYSSRRTKRFGPPWPFGSAGSSRTAWRNGVMIDIGIRVESERNHRHPSGTTLGTRGTLSTGPGQ